MKFYFCETCGRRVTDADVEVGQARNKKLKGVFCAECAIGVMTVEMLPVTEAEALKLLKKTPPPPADTPPASQGISGKPKREAKAVKEDAQDRSMPSSGSTISSKSRSIVAGVVAGLLIALVFVVLLLSNGDAAKTDPGKKDAPAKESAVVKQPAPIADKKSIAPPAEVSKSMPQEEKTVPAPTPIKTKEEPPQEKTVPVPVTTEEPPNVSNEMSLDLGATIKLEMKWIPAGEFEMGSDREKDQMPPHKVKITRPFYMGKFTVTQLQYEKVMGTNPSYFKGADMPVETVKWTEAEEFCKKVSALSGKTVRLPTEAEWEYACSAGAKTQFNIGDGEAALTKAGWYKANSELKPHPVGQKLPNAWGLYDMHGNVTQWCKDYFQVTYYSKSPTEDPQGPATGILRTIRGGSYAERPAHCQAAFRAWYNGDSGYRTIGFRVAANP